MSKSNYLACKDYAQDFLGPYISETEDIFRKALKSLDRTADCMVVGAADLCIPHDVIRLAGGFATGCYVEWSCKVPVVPVDTTVNVDTSSIYLIDADISSQFTPETFSNLIDSTTNGSSYVWNFNKGNHFISLCKSRSDGHFALIVHSNEKEFKYQTNGLVPVKGNWFWDEIQTFHYGGRYIRLLVGPHAAHFVALAKMLEEYNILRHRYFAFQLCRKIASILSERHDHHYFMPTQASVAMGVYICTPNQIVPIFSKPGAPIAMYKVAAGGPNSLRDKYLVPHGWGKTSRCPLIVNHENGLLVVNNHEFQIEPKVSLGKHPDLMLRSFDGEPLSHDGFFSAINQSCPGQVVDIYDQLMSYGQFGVQDFRSPK